MHLAEMGDFDFGGQEMGTFESSCWAFDPSFIGEIGVGGAAAAVDYRAAEGSYFWNPEGTRGTSNPSSLMEGFVNSDHTAEIGSCKRARSESSSKPSTKACREKMRRDKLNDRFLELSVILNPGKPPKIDKAAILSDAVQMVTQLHQEAEKFKESSDSLQEKIKELKAEKYELRNEKQSLKAEIENLEQQLGTLTALPNYVAPPHLLPATAFNAQGQSLGHKMMMPVISYPGYPMWQFMPPAVANTSDDAESFPPVA